MNELQKYLHHATRGLWGKHKLEIQEELMSDILERTRKFELAGFSRDHATLKALQELGNPKILAHGFWEVRMAMQKQFMLGSFAVIALLAIATWQSTARRNLNFSCVNSDQSTHFEAQTISSWFNGFSMARDLENLDWSNYGMKNVKTNFAERKDQTFLQIEGSAGEFMTKAKKSVMLERLKLSVQNPASSGAYILRCTLQ